MIRLAYNESSLPGTDRRGKLALACHLGLAVEVACHRRGDPTDPSIFREAGVTVSAVQAYGMHHVHPLHREAGRRREARAHVIDTLQVAARLEAERIVTVCSYGHALADRPRERVLDFFSGLVDEARALDIRILIEPLSPLRSSAFTNPSDVAALVDELAAPDVFGLVLDTGHMIDGGIDPTAFFTSWTRSVDELQLKGPGSTVPSLGLPVDAWIESLPAPPAVLCIEHRATVDEEGFRNLVANLRSRLKNSG